MRGILITVVSVRVEDIDRGLYDLTRFRAGASSIQDGRQFGFIRRNSLVPQPINQPPLRLTDLKESTTDIQISQNSPPNNFYL